MFRFNNYFIIYYKSTSPRKTTQSCYLFCEKNLQKTLFNLIFRASSFMLSVIPYSRGLSSVWRSTSSPQSSTSWPITSSTSSPFICCHWSSSPRRTPSYFTRFRKQREGTKVHFKVVKIFTLLTKFIFLTCNFLLYIVSKQRHSQVLTKALFYKV